MMSLWCTSWPHNVMMPPCLQTSWKFLIGSCALVRKPLGTSHNSTSMPHQPACNTAASPGRLFPYACIMCLCRQRGVSVSSTRGTWQTHTVACDAMAWHAMADAILVEQFNWATSAVSQTVFGTWLRGGSMCADNKRTCWCAVIACLTVNICHRVAEYST